MENVGNGFLGRGERVAASKGVKCDKEVLRGEEMKSLEDEMKKRTGGELLLY